MATSPTPDDRARAEADRFRERFASVRREIQKMIVGQEEVIDGVLAALFVGGHVLLEGVPGLGKTILVRSLAAAADLAFARVQFTPDLMPADIIGTNLLVESERGERRFQFQPGPIFSNIVLADEINRATPKTQSALLESMQEKQATVAGTLYQIQEPFLVLATQNPIEMEGTYPLPEAQLDRFFLKLRIPYPSADDLHEILARTTESSSPEISKVIGRDEILAMQRVVREVAVTRDLQAHAIGIVLASHPDHPNAAPLARKYVHYGASPRGVQSLILAAKVHALNDGRHHVAREDLHRVAPPALRHRILLNFEGEAEGRTPDDILAEILARAA